MMVSDLRLSLAALIAVLAFGCAPVTPPLPPPPVHANGQVLWRILHDQCVPDQLAHGDPAPCSVVSLADGEAHGFVVLKDRTGVAQYLLMPTAKITGIEDPAIVAPDAVNYFARAWDERGLVGKKLGRSLPDSQVSIAVNSIYGRSQDQLHLHIDCLDKAVAAALQSAPAPAPGRWASGELKGHRYRERWLPADALAVSNPFRLLAQEIPGARRDMGAWTVALVAAPGPGGAPGFLILASRANPAAGEEGSAEELQDHDCR